MREKKLGLPYMGSKRKLSKKIVDYILFNHPNTKYIYDLFGGGGAISMEFLQRKQIKKVIYNELNTQIVELLKDIRDNGVTPKYFEWISRETFKEHKDDQDWYGGMIASCWSFGNNKEKGYMFSKENEDLKRPLHKYIVNNCQESIKEFFELTKIDISNVDLSTEKSIKNKRFKLMQYIKSQTKVRMDLQHLEQLERLEQLESLELSNKSYEDVIIDTPIEETIIYCDPPYENTASYNMCINHDDFYNFVNNSPYKIYVSSYEAPLRCVKAFKHTCSLSQNKNNQVTEKLFFNKDELNKSELFNKLF